MNKCADFGNAVCLDCPYNPLLAAKNREVRGILEGAMSSV